jgi:hypothetical protein
MGIGGPHMSLQLEGYDGERTLIVVDDGHIQSRGFAHGPERALMNAVLFDAVMILTNFVGVAKPPSKYREALNWVMSKGNDYVFAFDTVCEGLGIDPDSLRLGILNSLNTTRGGKKLRRLT